MSLFLVDCLLNRWKRSFSSRCLPKKKTRDFNTSRRLETSTGPFPDSTDVIVNQIGSAGVTVVKSFAGVLGQCVSLTHLHLYCNMIGNEGAGRLGGVLALTVTRVGSPQSESGTLRSR